MKVKNIYGQSLAALVLSNGVYVYTFAANILLARLLLPEDFGSLALVLALVGFIEICTSFSLSAVFIQRRDHQTLLRSIFQVGILVIGLKLAIGFFVSLMFTEQYASTIWHLFWLVLISKGFSTLGPLVLAKLEKRGDFLKASYISTGSNLLGVTLAVLAVMQGAGIYGLILRVVAPPICLFLLMLLIYPSLFPHDLKKISRRQLSFVLGVSTKLYFQKGSELGYERIPLFLIESLFGSVVLGLFYQSTYLVKLVHRVTSPINHQIAFVFFAKNRRVLKESDFGYRILVIVNACFGIPLAVIFGLFSEHVVIFLWGEKWIEAAPLLQVMASMSVLFPIFTLLKSRLLGERLNNSITCTYLIGLLVFIIGLLVPIAMITPSQKIAGLAVLAVIVMILSLQIFYSLGIKNSMTKRKTDFII